MQNFYIHIPFCRQKCSYCNFSTIQNSENNTHENYFRILKKEINNYFSENKNLKIKTIYFWWWTPSWVDEKYIWEILEIFRNQFWNLEKIEVLMESNPEDLSWEKWIEKLENLKKIWISKISIWIQSFQEKFFDFFERKNYRAEKIISNAKKFFPNLSIDLIFWIPNQTKEDLKKDLEMVKKLDLKHISYYALDYKKNSKIQSKKEEWLDFLTVKNYYYEILDFLEKEWFEQYEFYNFCKNWNYNFHNKNFWELENYVWFWLSAVWSNWEKNFINSKNLKKYLDSNWEKKFFQEEENFSWFEKNFLELQKIFHLTRWKNISEIENILWIKNLNKKIPEFQKNTSLKEENKTNILEKNPRIKKQDLNNSEKILQNILNSKHIEKNSLNQIKLNKEWIMHFEDFFEEIFS